MTHNPHSAFCTLHSALPPLRVLHLTAGSDAGGISRYLIDLNAALADAGHRGFVAGERGQWHDRFANGPFPWLDAPLKGDFFALRRAGNSLIEFLRREPVDLLHVHYRRPALVARRIQKSLGIPILFTLHLSHIPLHWPWKWFTDFGDHTHVPASEAKRWLVDDAGVAAERITVIPHGIDPQRFPFPTVAQRIAARRSFQLEDHHTVAAYVGRLDTPKNEDWLLDVAAATRTSVPQLKILIAGDGPHAETFEAQISRRELRDRIVMLGELADPLPVYHAADAMLLPSQREGFSLACAEAMCTGVPVLRTATSGTEEMIVEGMTGRSTPIAREPFVAAAGEFLADREALRRMGQNAARHVQQHLTFARQFGRTVELYRTVVKSRRRRS